MLEPKICLYCGNIIKRHIRNSQKYCDRVCSSKDKIKPFNNHSIKGKVTEFYVKDKIILIDTKDLKKINDRSWYISSVGYVCNKSGKGVLLHRVLLGNKDNLVIDHINRNPLDNRRCNLRFVTHAENLRNTDIICNNTSGYKGITWSKKDKTWRPKLSVNNKTINLGAFVDIEDAIKARKEGELKHWGKNY